MLETLTKKQEALMEKISEKFIKNLYYWKKIDRKKVKEGINMMYKLSWLEEPKIIWLSSPLWIQYWANLLSEVRSEVRSKVESEKMKVFDFSYYGNISDYWWVAFYSYFQEIQISLWEAENFFNIFKWMILWGVYDMIQLENYCLVAELQLSCYKDERKRLHNTKWPAIEWRDWYKLYYINWIQIKDEKLYWKIVKDELTVEELLSIENNDTRAIAYDFFWKEKFANEPHKIIDKKIDEKGNEMKVIEFENKNIGRYYVGICPTTKKTHYLATTRDTCEEAKARSFWLKEIIFDNEF